MSDLIFVYSRAGDHRFRDKARAGGGLVQTWYFLFVSILTILVGQGRVRLRARWAIPQVVQEN